LQDRPDPKQLGAGLLSGSRKIWEFAQTAVQERKLKQSKSLFEMSQLRNLQKAFLAAWQKTSPKKRNDTIGSTEEAACDVLAFARALGGQAPDKAFTALRVGYVSTADMFTWDVDTSGLGFNFLGWKEPPCDFVPALGGKRGTRACYLVAGGFDGGYGGCDTYAKGAHNHKHCSFHWMKDLRAEQVCPECGVCQALTDIGKANRGTAFLTRAHLNG